MRIRNGKKRKNLIGLTSLIDVIFLLLLFFMLSSTFTKFTEFTLSAATAGPAQEKTEKPIIIFAHLDGRFEIEGISISASALKNRVQEQTEEGRTSAVLAPDKKMPTQQLVTILETLEQTDLQSVSLAR
ncbi:ExbD/TolR family protein [Sneathiella sp. HT1-7]|uniref:ExbD/TolR family protein n=1 Tax=Sneathiella sp. HT1-7 TaxID=2887192 RepID=UPI001D15A379|nr:biopolymer transporter ExbD [Sneathiella sp. HT1-7]MCC3306185.1 biopolymer transporter ExbD [Sneathiella sp. HT1-7]